MWQYLKNKQTWKLLHLLRWILQSICVFAVREFGPVGSLLILTIYNTSVCTHSHIHAKTGKQRAAQAHILTSRL